MKKFALLLVYILKKYKKLKLILISLVYTNKFSKQQINFGNEFINKIIFKFKNNFIYKDKKEIDYNFMFRSYVSSVNYSGYPLFFGYRKKRKYVSMKNPFYDSMTYMHIYREYKASMKKDRFVLPISFYFLHMKPRNKKYMYLKWRKPLIYKDNDFQYKKYDLFCKIREIGLELTNRFGYLNSDLKIKTKNENSKVRKAYGRVPLRWYDGKLADYTLDEAYVAVKESSKEEFQDEKFDDYLEGRCRVVFRHFIFTKVRMFLKFIKGENYQKESDEMHYNFNDNNRNFVNFFIYNMNLLKKNNYGFNKNENEKPKRWQFYKYYSSPSSGLPFNYYENIPFGDFNLDRFYNRWARKYKEMKKPESWIKNYLLYYFDTVSKYYFDTVSKYLLFNNENFKITKNNRLKEEDLLFFNFFDYFILIKFENQILNSDLLFNNNFLFFILYNLFPLLMYIFILLLFIFTFRFLLEFYNKKRNVNININKFESNYTFYENFSQYQYNQRNAETYGIWLFLVRLFIDDTKFKYLNNNKDVGYDIIYRITLSDILFKFRNFFKAKKEGIIEHESTYIENKFNIMKDLSLYKETYGLEFLYRDSTKIKKVMEECTDIKVPSFLNYFNHIFYFTSKENKHINISVLDGLFFNYYNKYIFEDIFYKVILKEASLNNIPKSKKDIISIIEKNQINLSKKDGFFRFDINENIISKSNNGIVNSNFYSKDGYTLRKNLFYLPTTKKRVFNSKQFININIYINKLFGIDIDKILNFIFIFLIFLFFFYQSYLIFLIVFLIGFSYYVYRYIGNNIYVADFKGVLYLRNLFLLNNFFVRDLLYGLLYIVIIIGFLFLLFNFYYILEKTYYIICDIYLINLEFMISNFFGKGKSNRLIKAYLNYLNLYISLNLNVNNFVLKRRHQYLGYRPYLLKKLYREFYDMGFKDGNTFSFYNFILGDSKLKLFQNWKMENYKPIRLLFGNISREKQRKKRTKYFGFYRFFSNIRYVNPEKNPEFMNFFGLRFFEDIFRSYLYFWESRSSIKNFGFYKLNIDIYIYKLNMYSLNFDSGILNIKGVIFIIKHIIKFNYIIIISFLSLCFILFIFIFYKNRKQKKTNEISKNKR